MLIVFIIFCLILAVITLLFLYGMKKNKDDCVVKLSNNVQHCYAFSIENVETGIYVLSKDKLSEDEIEVKKHEVLTKIYNDVIPEDAVVGVMYMGIMSNEGVK